MIEFITENWEALAFIATGLGWLADRHFRGIRTVAETDISQDQAIVELNHRCDLLEQDNKTIKEIVSSVDSKTAKEIAKLEKQFEKHDNKLDKLTEMILKLVK